MITSSLPPELKVLIASGFLLGGGLFAQRYPAEREEESVASQTVVVKRNETPTTSTTSQEPTSMAPGIDEELRFEPIKDFVVKSAEIRALPRMSIPDPVVTTSADRISEVEETSIHDWKHHAGMSADHTSLKSAAEQETAERPEFVPFQTTPVTVPEPNPAFFAARPSPPNLIGLSPSPVTFEPHVAIPRDVVAPSAAILSEIPARITPISTVAPLRETVARPAITPKPMATADIRTAKSNSSTVPPIREPRSNVIVAPARTTILPNPPTNL